jgi:hypothetical protein
MTFIIKALMEVIVKQHFSSFAPRNNSNKFGLFTRLVVGSFLGEVMPSPEQKPYSVDCHL